MHQRRMDNQINRQKKITHPLVKFPQIKQKVGNNNPIQPPLKSLKLQKINKKGNIAIADLAKITKIQRQFAVMTKRNRQGYDQAVQDKKHNKDQMRQSKLLLLKDITMQPPRKSLNQNLLSNLVFYHEPQKSAKTVSIPQSNITNSPIKNRKERSKQRQKYQSTSPTKQNGFRQLNKTVSPPTQYKNPKQLIKIDFVKMFIVEELLYYISRTRSKEEMSGFCKFYNQNTDENSYTILQKVLTREKDYLETIFLQKLGFYIFLILGTDSALQNQSSFLLTSLTDYLHTNNLIALDLLMQIIDYQNYQISSQFHVYNTSRFNEARRKINHNNQDKMNLLMKNNHQLVQIIKSILKDCAFDSLRKFILEILANQETQTYQKIKQVSLMLVSLDAILTSSLEKQTEQNQKSKPKPPFLSNKQKPVKYTLVLDMDQTLIHYVQRQQISTNSLNSSFLVRPYCHEFLQEMSQYYQLVIFTAAVKQYADSILDMLDKKNLISHRLYREHTRIQDYVSIKDLSLINRDLAKTIIIDNIQSNFKMQPRNGIAVSTWVGDPDDTSLLNLMPVLKKLATEGVQDVRDALETLSQYMESRIQNGQQVLFDKISLKGL